MFRRMIVTFLWAVGVLICSQLLLAFLSGLVFFAVAIAYGDSTTGDLIAKWVIRVFLMLSVGLTIATIVFGIRGQLPGARSTAVGETI